MEKIDPAKTPVYVVIELSKYEEMKNRQQMFIVVLFVICLFLFVINFTILLIIWYRHKQKQSTSANKRQAVVKLSKPLPQVNLIDSTIYDEVPLEKQMRLMPTLFNSEFEYEKMSDSRSFKTSNPEDHIYANSSFA